MLIGFALSRGGGETRIAFLNEVPEDERLALGENAELSNLAAEEELCKRVECVEVSSREEARAKVEDGEVLGALIVPSDLIERLQSLQGLNPKQPRVEVLVNEEDPVKAQVVDDRITSLVTEANLLIAKRVSKQAAQYLDLLVTGGDFDLLGQTLEILGLERAGDILRQVRREVAPADREQLDRVITFARLALSNLDLAPALLGAVAEPIAVDKRVVDGSSPSLDAFAISVAATVTLMFVTVLLVAGSLALEREENAYARLTRGLAAARPCSWRSSRSGSSARSSSPS